MLDQEEPAHVAELAKLARLDMDAAELSRMAGQLAAILRYAAKLDEVDITGVAPTTHTLDAVNALRDDEVLPSLPREAALQNAPQRNDEAFVVPKIIA